jgi:hypothetical protein
MSRKCRQNVSLSGQRCYLLVCSEFDLPTHVAASLRQQTWRKGNAMPTILAVGEDEILLSVRSAVLRCTGAEVLNSTASGAAEALAMRKFDLVILCHTLSVGEATEIALHARREGVRVLQIVPITTPELSFVPADDLIPSAPKFLMEKVWELLDSTDKGTRSW